MTTAAATVPARTNLYPVELRLERIDINDTEYQYRVPAGWKVIKTENDIFAAHWDSGHPDTPAVRVTLWNGDETKVGWAKEPTDFGIPNGQDDVPWNSRKYRRYAGIQSGGFATEAEKTTYEAYQKARDYVKDVREAGKQAYKLEVGTQVEVVKGRKVPLGTYEVASLGEGQYGPYAHLRDAAGKWYRYVSQSNIRAVPNFTRVFDRPRFTKDKTVHAFLITIAENGFADWTSWLVLADYFEEQDDTAFANALRFIATHGTSSLFVPDLSN